MDKYLDLGPSLLPVFFVDDCFDKMLKLVFGNGLFHLFHLYVLAVVLGRELHVRDSLDLI